MQKRLKQEVTGSVCDVTCSQPFANNHRILLFSSLIISSISFRCNNINNAYTAQGSYVGIQVQGSKRSTKGVYTQWTGISMSTWSEVSLNERANSVLNTRTSCDLWLS